MIYAFMNNDLMKKRVTWEYGAHAPSSHNGIRACINHALFLEDPCFYY